jgi:(4-(4-[2-(gamma-L-glutamylamino)ethyl]phenoxymethyl)furan-2-yl)methanamine synthase
MTVIGLDIGGANLKAAAASGEARARPFALWKRPDDLGIELRELLAGVPTADRWAVTMTGELCDCFADRREGVRRILTAVADIAGEKPVHVWRTDGRFAGLAEVPGDPLPAASANWLALATYAGRFAPAGSALLIDIGSTTTDIVPLVDGRPVPVGRTDCERLQSRELVYIGARRTPICALLEPGEGMAEFFATSLDVGLVLGFIAQDEGDHDTADGRPATREFAAARLARMLGGDDTALETIHRFAERLANTQREIVVTALATVAARMPRPLRSIVISGSGASLAAAAVKQFVRGRDSIPEVIDLSKQLGPDRSTCACALAVATLLSEKGPL